MRQICLKNETNREPEPALQQAEMPPLRNQEVKKPKNKVSVHKTGENLQQGYGNTVTDFRGGDAGEISTHISRRTSDLGLEDLYARLTKGA